MRRARFVPKRAGRSGCYTFNRKNLALRAFDGAKILCRMRLADA